MSDRDRATPNRDAPRKTGTCRQTKVTDTRSDTDTVDTHRKTQTHKQRKPETHTQRKQSQPPRRGRRVDGRTIYSGR